MRNHRWPGAGTIAGVLATGVALAVSASPGAAARLAAAPCRAASTEVWVGLGTGGGFAGGYVLPLEFSNIGRRACTLRGYPGVSAYRGSLRQVGPPARRIPGAAPVVLLRPRGTAHALLRVSDTGALCGRAGVVASGLRVYPPGQYRSQTITMRLNVCARRVTLAVGALRRGPGIPGHIGQ